MSKVISRLALVALALIVMGSLMVKADDDGWTLKWDGGFKLTDADGDFELKWGGRMMNDWLWIASFDDDLAAVISETPAGMEWRRARLFVSGKAYGNIEFKAQYDFAGGDVDFKDLYMGITGTPVGTFRFGHFKAPFSLEELTSSKYITFMERSLPNVFAIGRDTGFAILGHNGDKTITWGFGLFVDSDDYAVNTDHDHDAWEVVGRVTFLPMHENNDLLHVGAGFYFRDLEDNAVRFRSRPEVHLGSRFVDTHSFEADSVTGLGLELAYVGGPLSFQSEFMYTMVGSTEYNDPNFMGY